MPGRFKWYDPRRYLRDRKRDSLEQVVEQLVAHARALVGVEGPAPSAPGEPPHKQSGALQAGIFGSVSDDGAKAMLGTNVEYGYILEVGSHRMAARPWMARSGLELAGRLKFREFR